MPSGKQVTTGIVLRQTDTKETDMILTVLTPDLGRIPVIAKGARSKRSKFAAACQLLTFSELTLTHKGNWYYLDEASTIELFAGVRQDLTLLALASYFAELTEAVCGEETPELLRLLLNALYALGTLGKDPTLVKTAFTWRLMALSGFEPLMDGCAVCGREPETAALDVVQGVLHCAGCKTGGLSLPLTSGAVSALRRILACEPKRLYSFSLEPTALRQLDHAAEAFVSAQLERSFRTLEYYKSIL